MAKVSKRVKAALSVSKEEEEEVDNDYSAVTTVVIPALTMI